jgi:hypothetical protein
MGVVGTSWGSDDARRDGAGAVAVWIGAGRLGVVVFLDLIVDGLVDVVGLVGGVGMVVLVVVVLETVGWGGEGGGGALRGASRRVSSIENSYADKRAETRCEERKSG